jgi:hypothetical protein
MAKVALITEEFSPLVESLATALSHQKQEVVIVTSRSAAEKVPSHLSALAPFKTWSAMEAVRSLPALVAQNFDVWHFLFPTGETRPLSAQWILATVARSLPQKVIAGSFSSPESLRGWDSRFLSLMDLALFSNRSFLMKEKRRRHLAEHTLAEVLPPLEGVAVHQDAHLREESHRLLSCLRPFLVLPDLHDGPNWLDNSPLDFVVLKPHPRRGSKHRHVFYTGDVSPAERDLFIERSRGICLLYGDYSVLELQRFHQWSEKSQRPLLVRKRQTEIWPGLCWHLKSGWVLEDGGDPLQPLLIENPNLELPQGFENYSQREIVDSTLNQLLRLYQRSFVQRWT